MTLHGCYHDTTQLVHVHVHLQQEMQEQHYVHGLDSILCLMYCCCVDMVHVCVSVVLLVQVFIEAKPSGRSEQGKLHEHYHICCLVCCHLQRAESSPQVPFA